MSSILFTIKIKKLNQKKINMRRTRENSHKQETYDNLFNLFVVVVVVFFNIQNYENSNFK